MHFLFLTKLKIVITVTGFILMHDCRFEGVTMQLQYMCMYYTPVHNLSEYLVLQARMQYLDCFICLMIIRAK